MSWDFARLWHAIALNGPDRPALRHGPTTVTWQEFNTAAGVVAERLRAAGLRRGDVAALCLRNKPEYLVIFAGALRCGVSPCGVNYRYTANELAEILRQIKPAAVFYDQDDAATATAARARLTTPTRWTPVEHGEPAAEALSIGSLLDAARDYGPLDSSPEDVLLKCTGGTTGHPVAIRWRSGDVLRQINEHNPWQRHDLNQAPAATPAIAGVDARLLVASPLMHGSGLTRALGALCAGGTVTTLPDRSFRPASALDLAASHRADTIAITGDAHAALLADALSEEPGRWPLAALQTITSSGAIWSLSVQQRLLGHLPHVQLTESFGATEATGLGFRIATAETIPPASEFHLGPHAIVINPDHGPAKVGETGFLGVSRPRPLGLHPAGQLPSDRFVDVGGQTYLLSGDHVRFLEGGRFVFLGRDADCINTGGEKVYAPEVAAVLTSHPDVIDAAVFGLADPRFGHTVTALVRLRPAASLDGVAAYTRDHLASYKRPTTVVPVEGIPRSDAGKLDLCIALALAVGMPL